jgi:hypothetical protein
MLLLSRLYHHSPSAFYGFLLTLFEDADLGLKFGLQEHGKKTVPDASISQLGFKIVCETKLDAKHFNSRQLKGHCEGSFGNLGSNLFLLTLSPQPLIASEQQRIDTVIDEVGNGIRHAHLTFKALCDGVRDDSVCHEYND